MSRRGTWVMALASAAALAGGLLVAGTPAALAGPARAAGGAARTADSAAPATLAGSPGARTRQVMLVTGDVVTVSAQPGGRQTASVARAHPQGPAGQFRMFSNGGDLYVVPQSAVPYLGTTLSPSLFDVTRLARHQNGPRSLAVTVRLRRPAGPASLPGISLTRRSGLTATGRLTESSARRFGAALARQATRDRGSAARASGLFAGVARISAAGVQPRQERPQFPMYTLALNGINAAGGKDTGDLVTVYNADDLRKYAGNAVFYQGQAKISVPAGHYTAICFFFNFTTGAVATVTIPQFTVTGSGSSVTLDARTATSQVSVRTPQAATPAVTEVTVARGDHRGLTGSDSFLGTGATTFTVAPVSTPVSVGQLYYYVYARLFSPSGAKTPYSYDVEFPSDGAIPADQHYIAKPASLAAVGSSYPAEHASQAGLDTRFAALPWQSFLFAVDQQLTTPLRRTEYYTASPDMAWQGVYYSVFTASTFTLQGLLNSSWTAYPPGAGFSVTWGGQPAHPRLLQTPLGVGQVYCPACISGDTVHLLAFPYSDNSPDHFGYPDGAATGLTESASYHIYADGLPVARGTGVLQKKVTVPAGTKDLLIDYATTRSSSAFSLSTSADTRWTVRTGAHRGALPSGWYCDFAGQTACSVLPLLTADYTLPLNMLGQLGPGAVTAGLDVSHLAGATDVAVTSLSLQVSFDGGATWRKATLTSEGSGRYAVSFTVPAVAGTDGFGALRLHATDAYGGTLSQTIQRAFAVSAAAGPAVAAAPADSHLAAARTAGRRAAPGAACGRAGPGRARCFAVIRTDTPARAAAARADRSAAAPPGFGPASLESAYSLPISDGAGQTVALVDAYDDPTAAADLAAYRARYGLPPCTAASGCFTKVNQAGRRGGYPPTDDGWAVEISLDLDMVSAACPRCHILLVEASSNQVSALARSAATAARLGADVISNSYGLNEYGGMSAYFADYHPARAAVVAASGDFGFGAAQFPAVAPGVTAAGGTSLYRSSLTHRGWIEHAWAGSGSGCSAYVTKPSYQHDRHCGMRTVADVSSVADPSTGLAVYDTTPNPYGLPPGWLEVGGTSAASPLIAGVIGLAGDGPAFGTGRLYAHGSDLNDVTSGSNGYCGGDYLCTATKGYDGPTGMGTPDGIGAF